MEFSDNEKVAGRNQPRILVHSARDGLTGLNKGNEQKLGEFGFNVTEEERQRRKRKSKRPGPG